MKKTYVLGYKRPANDAGLMAWAFHILVCVATISRYSHVEVVLSEHPPLGRVAGGWSSSSRAGGVRLADIMFDPARWDCYEVPNAPKEVESVFLKLRGKLYDYFGLLAVWLWYVAPRMHLVWRKMQHSGKYFCSEAAAAALQLRHPYTWSPGRVMRWAKRNGVRHA